MKEGGTKIPENLTEFDTFNDIDDALYGVFEPVHKQSDFVFDYLYGGYLPDEYVVHFNIYERMYILGDDYIINDYYNNIDYIDDWMPPRIFAKLPA